MVAEQPDDHFALDRAAQLLGDDLPAVADAEHRHLGSEDDAAPDARSFNALKLNAERQSNLAGTENGLVASTTNMMRADRSVVPALKTSIAIPPICPFMVCPAST